MVEQCERAGECRQPADVAFVNRRGYRRTYRVNGQTYIMTSGLCFATGQFGIFED